MTVLAPVPILYHDQDLVIVDKTSGVPVHAGPMADPTDVPLLQRVRDQLGAPVFPCHRLDRATSGVVIFALDKHILSLVSSSWTDVEKIYSAFVRGWPPSALSIDEPLHVDGQMKPAITHCGVKKKYLVPWPSHSFPQTRYSLLCITPETGRFHQIRRHLNHRGYPILGDTTHGDGEQNRLVREHLQLNRLMLHCQKLKFNHPRTGQDLTVEAPFPFFEQVKKLAPFEVIE
jgi:tRNA pseudouridine65 synthase